MLCEITIENVAVIEKATAVFGEGFTVLTGETGAGKSILIDSINAILGNRTSRDIVRSGATKARIWARFAGLSSTQRAALEDAGYETEGELLLYREITVEGKSTCRINGAPATAALLREVCGGLIHIHGQHDNQSLLNPALHLGVLDAFAGNEVLLEEYAEKYSALRNTQAEMKTLEMDEAEKARKIDLLRYETQEIEGAELEIGEEDALLAQREVIRNSQHILTALNTAYLALSGDDETEGAAGLLGEANNALAKVAAFAPELAGYAETLGELYYSAGELASDIQSTLQGFSFDGEALDVVEGRLDILYRLKQKYGSSIEAILEYGQKARLELDRIEFSEEHLRHLQSQYAVQKKECQALAAKLHTARKTAFKRLQAEITGALEFLNMPGIVMALHSDETELGPNGADIMEFYISTNPGEAPKPLAKIASGGELARIMLAIKSALAGRDDIATVIYDEIDTGISGLAAGRIGQLLARTAKGRQVICVTHTAQVAAYATDHLLIQKQVLDGRTYTNIQPLSEDKRVDELARIVSGDAVTDTTRASAREMLIHAKKQ